MYKYYVTPSPDGIDGRVSEVTTVYMSVSKALEYLAEKTPVQLSQLYIRKVDMMTGIDAGIHLDPAQIQNTLSHLGMLKEDHVRQK